MLTLALVALPVVLLLLGLPIFLILLAASATVLLFVLDVPPAIIHQQMFGSIDKFALLAVPFFIFAGEIDDPLLHEAAASSSSGSSARNPMRTDCCFTFLASFSYSLSICSLTEGIASRTAR